MIGIDVGGANVKIVDREGIHIHYCPLWKGAPLRDTLLRYRTDETVEAAVVISGELADCFHSKYEGISWIVETVSSIFPSATFYGTDGRFHDGPHPSLAAGNWLAAADYLSRDFPGALLVDMGSTTTDIVPLGVMEHLIGMTDLRRMREGFLVYTGLLRTPVSYHLQELELGDGRVMTSSEIFSVSADAHLVLGHIDPLHYTCDTPDGHEKTYDASLRRLARTVCADVEEIGVEGCIEIASAFWSAQRQVIREAVTAVVTRYRANRLLIAGIGTPLITRDLGGEDLDCLIGPVSDALPAFAVREVAEREGGASG